MPKKKSIWKSYEKRIKKGSADNISSMFEADRFINPFNLFFNLTGRLGNRLIFADTDKASLYHALIKEFNISDEDIIKAEVYDPITCLYEYNSGVFIIAPNLWVYFNSGYHDMPAVEIIHHNSDKKIFERVQGVILSHPQRASAVNSIYLLSKEGSGEIGLRAFEINYAPLDLSSNYNDSLISVHEIITRRLNDHRGKGIVMLYGKPGTGKTNYIRHLIATVKKRMIYISPDMAHLISDPGFITLLSRYPHSILVIEDAENILEERRGHHNSAVSNLLGLTDGLLGDCFSIELVCSFNTDISKIDSALLRKGRLIAKYEFKPLIAEKAQALSNSLGNTITIEKDLTLAEIYNLSEHDFSKGERKKIGFQQ